MGMILPNFRNLPSGKKRGTNCNVSLTIVLKNKKTQSKYNVMICFATVYVVIRYISS